MKIHTAFIAIIMIAISGCSSIAARTHSEGNYLYEGSKADLLCIAMPFFVIFKDTYNATPIVLVLTSPVVAYGVIDLPFSVVSDSAFYLKDKIKNFGQ